MENNTIERNEVETLMDLNMTGFSFTAKKLGLLNGKINILTIAAGVAAIMSTASYVKDKKRMRSIERKIESIHERLDKE